MFWWYSSGECKRKTCVRTECDIPLSMNLGTGWWYRSLSTFILSPLCIHTIFYKSTKCIMVCHFTPLCIKLCATKIYVKGTLNLAYNSHFPDGKERSLPNFEQSKSPESVFTECDLKRSHPITFCNLEFLFVSHYKCYIYSPSSNSKSKNWCNRPF